MKKFIKVLDNNLFFIIGIAFLWKIILFLPEFIGKQLIPQRSGFIGETPWANFDGAHYLSIAKDGYFQYEYAFFPLFPILIRHLEKILRVTYLQSALLIISISFIAVLFFLYKLSLFDVDRKDARWVMIFFLAFPTSFFFVSVYSESLFLALSIASFYAARKKHWVVAGVLGGLASATRFVGIFLFPALIVEYLYQNRKQIRMLDRLRLFIKDAWGILLIPLGLAWYMYYLYNLLGDALAFVHSQSAFGANRSSGEIILLPQVIFRYVHILTSLSTSNYDFWIALFEFVIFSLILIFLIVHLKSMRISYLVYSLCLVIVPTLSGTLSSEPRYVLAAFPIFIYLATIRNTFVKCAVLVSGVILEIILTSLFLRGYFVS